MTICTYFTTQTTLSTFVCINNYRLLKPLLVQTDSDDIAMAGNCTHSTAITILNIRYIIHQFYAILKIFLMKLILGKNTIPNRGIIKSMASNNKLAPFPSSESQVYTIAFENENI